MFIHYKTNFFDIFDISKTMPYQNFKKLLNHNF